MDPNLLSPTEEQALQILENNTILKNGHFETPLLWKSEFPKLPNNRNLAKKWFQSLENKFAKNPELTELYRIQINEYIDLGHAVKLTNHSLNISDSTNYVLYHGVLNIDKPGRVMVVFDACAKYNNIFKSKFTPRSRFTQQLSFCSHKIPPRKVRPHDRYRENVPSSFCQPK